MKNNTDPRMHSAEHILNQTMIRMFDTGRCFSAHIEKKKSKCDYRFDRPLTTAETRRIENEVNRIIRSDLPIRETFMTRQDAQAEFSLERLPEEAGDSIRIMTIEDYDACPCIGPHVRSTAEIGEFRIGTTGFESGVLRIRFKLSGKS